MNATTFIKLLTDVEHDLARRKNNALARGRWVVALQVEAQEELCRTLRKIVAENPEDNVQTLPEV